MKLYTCRLPRVKAGIILPLKYFKVDGREGLNLFTNKSGILATKKYVVQKYIFFDFIMGLNRSFTVTRVKV